MNAFEIGLAVLFPALGGIGAWVAWNLAQDWVGGLRQRRRGRYYDELISDPRAELPDNPRLAAEIDRLR